jgi:hypothetical protein
MMKEEELTAAADEIPPKGADWWTGGGCLGLGAIFVAAPAWYFVSPYAAAWSLGAVVVVAWLSAIHEGKEARRKANEQAAFEGRFRELAARWDVKTATKIVAGQLWKGQTAEMLRLSLGEPEAIEEKVLKTKVTRVYKYGASGPNRFKLKVKLDDDEVVGWEDSR